MNSSALPFGWFDIVVVVFIVFGVLRGRKHGMSEELMYVLQWLMMVGMATAFYQPMGQFLADSSYLSLLFCYVSTYIFLLILVRVLFAVIKRGIGGKLIGSDVFGGAEYYLGMVAGAFRFALILIAILAVINARYYSPKEVAAQQHFQMENYGKEYFPGLRVLQEEVFERSILGRQTKENLGVLLIKPTAPESKEIKRKELDLP